MFVWAWDCDLRQCLLPGLQELTLRAVTSVLVFALLLLSNLILRAAEDCAHWLLAALTVGGIFFQLSKRAGLKQPVTAEAGRSCASFPGNPAFPSLDFCRHLLLVVVAEYPVSPACSACACMCPSLERLRLNSNTLSPRGFLPS